jgi:N-methylhydantoinase A
VEVIVHGTPVTTNAVLTFIPEQTGLLTTRGVREALEMRRGIREEHTNNRYQTVQPLVGRYLRRPVAGRLDYAGREGGPLNMDDVREAVGIFQAEGVQAVAVCFMNSFANREHEEAAARLVSELMPGAYLTVSSRLLPSIRFYDRVSTTVLNSYVGPILKRYLDALTRKLAEVEFPAFG